MSERDPQLLETRRLKGNVEAGLRLLLKSEKRITRRVAEVCMEDLDALAQRVEDAETALEALLDHAERIQEHVPKSEHWYAVRDCARQALRQEDE